MARNYVPIYAFTRINTGDYTSTVYYYVTIVRHIFAFFFSLSY